MLAVIYAGLVGATVQGLLMALLTAIACVVPRSTDLDECTPAKKVRTMGAFMFAVGFLSFLAGGIICYFAFI